MFYHGDTSSRGRCAVLPLLHRHTSLENDLGGANSTLRETSFSKDFLG